MRDKIPQIVLEKEGKPPMVRIAHAQEYEEAICDKIIEEMQELRGARNAEEAADVLEALRAFCAFHKIPWGQVEIVRREKKKKRGGFAKRIIMEVP